MGFGVDLPHFAAARCLGRRQPHRAEPVVQCRRLGAPGLSGNPPVPEGGRPLDGTGAWRRACRAGHGVSCLGDGRQGHFADRHAPGDACSRRADRAGGAWRNPVRTGRGDQYRHRGHASCRGLRRRAVRLADGGLGRHHLRDADRRRFRAAAGGAGDHLPGRPDHRRCRHQPVRSRPDLLRLEPGLRRVPLAQQGNALPRLQDPRPRRHPADRAGAVQPEPVRLRRACPRHPVDLLPIPYTPRASCPRGWRASARRRHARHRRHQDPLRACRCRRHGGRLRRSLVHARLGREV